MTTKDLSKIFFIPRGDNFPINLTVEDGNGDPINLTGKSIILVVKKKLNDPDETAIITKTVNSHVTPVQGISLITLTPSDTNIDDSGVFQGQFQLVDGTNPTTFERCGFQFLQDVV